MDLIENLVYQHIFDEKLRQSKTHLSSEKLEHLQPDCNQNHSLAPLRDLEQRKIFSIKMMSI